MNLEHKKVMVVGMARSGIASARLLMEKGADVVLYDAKELGKFAPHTFDEFDGRAVFAFGSDAQMIAKDADLLVLSQGSPLILHLFRPRRRMAKW